MSSTTERFTATLSQLRPREVANRRHGRVTLTIDGPGGQRVATADGQRITIGAHRDAGIVAADPAISNVHCELRVQDGEIVLRDLSSKNGTWIGDVRVREVVLPIGGSFRLGATTVTVDELSKIDVPMSLAGRFGDLHGVGSKMGELFAQLERIAAFPIDALVVGETGTGKELVARGIHDRSDRNEGPFIVVDCPNLNEGIAESILFGHAKGSFTGATSDRPGLLEEADGGTLFLDELGELPLTLQAKLLRALEQRQTRRLGETTYRSFSARVVAATNRDLTSMVSQQAFREDLYFRLAPVTVELPPLRERGHGDIAMLADLFLGRLAETCGRPMSFDKGVYEVLAAASWPGNVRQLKNAVQLAAMNAESGTIRTADLPTLALRARPSDVRSEGVDAVIEALDGPWETARSTHERLYLTTLMQRAGGNRTKAADLAGMARSSFRDLVKRAFGGGGE